jgi:pimeloyl-ACP methyl ester carboxylesterase
MQAAQANAIPIEVNGVRSRVLDTGPAGAAEAIVFVHGSPGDAGDWQALMPQVAPFARCIALDMPGYGEADKPSDFPYTTEGYALHLGGVLRQLRVNRCHLVGHDLGCAWGLGWAAAQPDALASLTLINTGVLPEYRWHRFARLYQLPLIGELMLATSTTSVVAWAMNQGSKHAVPRGFAARAAGAYRDASTRRAILRYYRATDLARDTVAAATALTPVDPPTLVIWGRGDPYVPVRYAAVQKEYFRRAQVVILPDSGHWPFLDDPDRTAAAVVPFLRDQISGN